MNGNPEKDQPIDADNATQSSSRRGTIIAVAVVGVVGVAAAWYFYFGAIREVRRFEGHTAGDVGQRQSRNGECRREERAEFSHRSDCGCGRVAAIAAGHPRPRQQELHQHRGSLAAC